MHAMVVEDWGEPDDLKFLEVDDPQPGAGEVAIDVKAVGCNFFDILIAQGKYQVQPPRPFSPGGEVAGIIRAVGPGVTGFNVGDRVFAMLGWGGYATVAVAPVASVARMPDAMTFEEGAAFGIVYQTSYFALVYRGQLQPGETLLVHAAAGGVGLAAVQIGAALGARVIGTASSPQKLEIAVRHGAEVAFDTRPRPGSSASRTTPADVARMSSTIRSAARSSTSPPSASPSAGGCWPSASPQGPSGPCRPTACC
jgi:NADPH2:quinone reductase